MGRLAGGAGYWGRQKTSRDAPDALWHLLQLTGPLRSLSGGVHLPVVQGSKRAAQVDEGQSLAEVRALLDAPLQPNSQLVTGRLDNGLNYVILPNAVPPERFEAHLEIHAGARSARRPPPGPVPSVQPPPDMLHSGRALAAPLAIVSGPAPPPAGAASGAEVAGRRRLSARCALTARYCQSTRKNILRIVPPLRAGSVDERPDQQGLAHLVEHVTFLGSFRREQLLGTGARSNAYTDFHHTVFHVHAPLTNTSSPQATPMLPQARARGRLPAAPRCSRRPWAGSGAAGEHAALLHAPVLRQTCGCLWTVLVVAIQRCCSGPRWSV